MARDADAVIYGEALCFTDDYVDDGSEDFPDPDTIDYGDEWGGTWTEVGYTQEGITLSISHEYDEIEVDQELDALFTPLTGREMGIEMNLAEFTPANLLLSSGQGATSTVAAGSGTHGYDQYAITTPDNPQLKNVGVDILHPADNEPVRVIGWKGQPTSDMEAVFGNRADNAQIPISFRLLPDTGTTPSRVLTVRDYITELP